MHHHDAVAGRPGRYHTDHALIPIIARRGETRWPLDIAIAGLNAHARESVGVARAILDLEHQVTVIADQHAARDVHDHVVVVALVRGQRDGLVALEQPLGDQTVGAVADVVLEFWRSLASSVSSGATCLATSVLSSAWNASWADTALKRTRV